MKIKLGFTLLALVVANLLFSQSADVTQGCAPLTVNFTAPAGHTSWYWDFKDVTTSLQENPATIFSAAGVYNVEFRETPGDSIIGTVTITVSPKPSFSFSTSTSRGCAPLPISFTASGTPPAGITINSYDWVYGDGNGGTGTTVNHTYSAPGNYDISLKITTSSITCDTTKIFSNYIATSAPPAASFVTTPNPAIACAAPLTVSFLNTSTSTALPLTYEWDIDGTITTAENPSDKTYSADGDYTAKLTVTDTNGCARTTPIQKIAIGKPVAAFSMPDTACINDAFNAVALVNTSSLGFSGNYLWTFDPGTNILPPSNTSTFQPLIWFSTGGNHDVTLSATSPNGLCSHDTTITVFVEEPTVGVISTPTYSCSEPRDFLLTGSSPFSVVSWVWRLRNLEAPFVDIDSSGPVITHTFVVPDSMYTKRGRNIFQNRLEITTANGCKADTIFNDTIHLVWARFMPDTAQGCVPLTVVFSDSSHSNDPDEPIVNWAWDYGDGTPVVNNSTKAPHPHTYTSPGEYDVVLIATNSAGCKDTSYAITINAGDIKAVDFSADVPSVCIGESVTFTHTTTDTAGIDGWNYSSNGEFLSHCFTDENPTVVFDDSVGFQDITMIANYNGCLTEITKPAFIEVKGPKADFDFLMTCGPTSYEVQFTDLSGAATGLSWDFGDLSPLQTTTGTFTHTYTASGDYNVSLTATNAGTGCPASVDMVTLPVRKVKAQFTTDTTICIGVPYTFDASASTDAFGSCNKGYSWVLSDSANVRPYTSDIATQLIPFDLAGVQTIGLVVRDVNGCADTLTQQIKVYSSPALYSLSDTVICIPDTIQFTDLTIADTTLVKWDWDFGDGSVDSVQNPIHIYDSVLTASITTSVTITDILGCISSTTIDMNIYSLASSVTTLPTSPNVCFGDSILFTASDFTTQGSSLTYNWDFQDGTTEAGNNRTHTYANSGAYTVKLYYSEIATGCQDSTPVSVTVQDYPQVGFYSDSDTLLVLCHPSPIELFDTSKVDPFSMPLSVIWDIDNGTNIFTTAGSKSIVLTKDGSPHSIKLTSTTPNGCATDTTKLYTVVGPEGEFNFDVDSICKGDTIMFNIIDTADVGGWSWSYGDGFIESNVDSVKHQYNFIPPSGQTKVTLALTGPGGICPVSVVKLVSIRYVKADFVRNSGLDTTVCFGNPILLTNSSSDADLLTWTLGDGETSSETGAFNHNYATIDTFSISLAVENVAFGCRDTITKDVVVNALPQVTAVGDSACKGAPVQLSVTSFDSTYSYAWTDTTGLSDPAIYNPTFTGVSTSDYYVTATIDSTGCVVRDTAFVFVAQPLDDVDWDTTIVIGEFITLPIDNDNGFLVFDWTPTKDLSCLDCSYPELQPLESIIYTAYREDIIACFNATSTFDITVRPETFVKLPTTFTPNGDGFNDIIYVEGWGIKTLIAFQIYNRWGELLFTSTELTHGWDGYYKGMLQNNETYVYKVIAETFRNEEIIKEGHINLMR